MNEKRNIRVEDLRDLRFVSDPQISPNGDRVTFVHTTIENSKDDYVSNLWMADLKKGETSQFTFGRGKDQSPRWSPDGSQLLFTSVPMGDIAQKRTQIYVISATGGEARQITEIEGGAIKPRWAPDGNRIFFISSLRKGVPETDLKVITRIKYKYDSLGYYDGRRNHLFTVSAYSKELRQVTEGEFDVDAAEWLGDGESIAFISNLNEDADLICDKFIYTIDSRGGEPRSITDGPKVINSLKPSPGGKIIAYIGHDYRNRLWSNQDIWLIDAEGGTSQNLTQLFDQDIGYKLSCDVRIPSQDSNPQWSGGDIYFTSTYGGVVKLHRVPSKGGKVEAVLGDIDHSVEAWSISENGVIAYNIVSTTSPIEMWVMKEGIRTQITDFNGVWRRDLNICGHEKFTFMSSGGHNVEGWLMCPPGFKEDDQCPMVLYIRGGSGGCFGYGFMHEYQSLAAQGWAILYVNQWGNGGYNEEFQSKASGHYGQQEYADLMEAVDYVLSHYNFINPNRLGVTGISQGGFLTNWIITHNNRFKAAIPQACVSNWHSFFGTSDIGWTFGRYDMEGFPWADEEKYLSMSPIRYATAVKAPTLIIHSDEDYRCSFEQAAQWFTALKYLKVPSELVIFPREGHYINRPQHREKRLHHIIRWFKTYL
ncbi:MAG: S9 family peptidase [Candidatus Bathyarchaeota archaeon]|nr:S9 family peptidase [Candidatus Bathyarchaeota archaeon]